MLDSRVAQNIRALYVETSTILLMRDFLGMQRSSQAVLLHSTNFVPGQLYSNFHFCSIPPRWQGHDKLAYQVGLFGFGGLLKSENRKGGLSEFEIQTDLGSEGICFCWKYWKARFFKVINLDAHEVS